MNAPAASTGSRILDDLAEVIGEAAALDLVWAFRGQMLYVPKDPATEPMIADAIGEKAAAKLCNAFWRTHIYMPFTKVLESKVLAMNEAGSTRLEIARELGIAERRVYRILERIRGSAASDPDQPRLI